MRCLVVAVSLVIACTAPQEAPVAGPPVAAEKVAATPPAPPVVAPVTAPVVAAPVVEAPPPAPTLSLGPDLYQLPAGVKCDDMEPGPFCGVYIIDMSDREVTTVVTRDHKQWVARAGANETPTRVEFVELPRAPEHLKRAEALFGSGAFVSVAPAHPILPEPFMLEGVRSFYGDFVLLGDKLYVDGLVGDSTLVEIDPKARSFQALTIAGKTTSAVLPGGSNLALYLSGKRRKSVALFDVATRKPVVEVEVPRDLEPECRRSHHEYGEDGAVFVPASGRFYVGFSCVPDA